MKLIITVEPDSGETAKVICDDGKTIILDSIDKGEYIIELPRGSRIVVTASYPEQTL